MLNIEKNTVDLKTMSPLALAFLGDGVYALLVRESLLREANRPAGQLHVASVRQVQAAAQAKAVQQIIDFLSEEELSVFKRGRNAHTKHTPKNVSEEEYHAATGLETLFGYLYLKGDEERLRELFRQIIAE